MDNLLRSLSGPFSGLVMALLRPTRAENAGQLP